MAESSSRPSSTACRGNPTDLRLVSSRADSGYGGRVHEFAPGNVERLFATPSEPAQFHPRPRDSVELAVERIPA